MSIRGPFTRFALSICVLTTFAAAGTQPATEYRVLSPLSSGTLTIFPVVAKTVYDTSGFITLDEGLRSGEVVITEAGRVAPMVRNPRMQPPIPQGGAEVNRLVLVNNSKRPLLLLAGEIVTGGKQDRVIGKDRIVPAESDPIDLGVFCVEPGRWTERTSSFGAEHGAYFGALSSQMAQPSVRGEAMASKNQQQVWDKVARAKETVSVQASAPAVNSESSYAIAMSDGAVQRKLSEVTAPIERSYDSLRHQLKDQHAVGVVVAVGDRIIWADLFASPELLEKYWPKLVRSYAAEAIGAGRSKTQPGVADAQAFLASLTGKHQSIDSEPGIYRSVETVGSGFRVFELASLLPKASYEVHVSKISETDTSAKLKSPALPVRPME